MLFFNKYPLFEKLTFYCFLLYFAPNMKKAWTIPTVFAALFLPKNEILFFFLEKRMFCQFFQKKKKESHFLVKIMPQKQ